MKQFRKSFFFYFKMQVLSTRINTSKLHKNSKLKNWKKSRELFKLQNSTSWFFKQADAVKKKYENIGTCEDFKTKHLNRRKHRWRQVDSTEGEIKEADDQWNNDQLEGEEIADNAKKRYREYTRLRKTIRNKNKEIDQVWKTKWHRCSGHV